MMQTNRLRVSIVIPAYNEESYLPRCLDAIAAQIVKPFEVIVVDNNSTDRTAAIARSYPFVKVVHEPLQGKVFARDAGFNAARGDIIGRIDADTLLDAQWVRQVQTVFAEDVVDAVVGRPFYYDIAFPRVSSVIENGVRAYMARKLHEAPFLQGANMALRRTTWHHIRSTVCHDDETMHEDLDLSLHAQQRGWTVAYDKRMVAGLSARRADTPFSELYEYVRMTPRTYALHNVPNYRRMYPALAVVLLLYLPARIMFRGCHPRTQRFSLLTALSRSY